MGRRKSVKKRVILAFVTSLIPLASAQTCISLAGSTQCSAFNQSSISTGSDLQKLFGFLAFVSSTESFDAQLSQYVNSSYVQQKYQQLLGCSNVDLTNTTNYYARYTTSVICNSIVQNSIKPCGLSNTQTTPLCADSCAQLAITEEEIAVDKDLCGDPGQDYLSQIRADFIQCSLPPGSLAGTCITGEENEPNNCGFSSNVQGLCRYCGASSPNATDLCCYNSNATGVCAGVVLPTLTAMPSLALTVSATATATATASASPATASTSSNGLSGGAIAGIVIGSVVAAILLAGLLLLCCICLRRRRRSQHGSLNQPSPKRSPHAGARARDIQPAPGGRVARMTALEGESNDEKNRGVVGGVEQSDSDPYGDSPETRGLQPPPASQRRGSLSSNSIFGGGLDDTSPSNQYSSPEGMQSGQSEQLPFFKDYYSSDEIHPGDRVATLWAYQPRATDEFELERGDMLKVVGIWDDGWATGIRIPERAEDNDGKYKMQRDSGVSNVTGQREPTSPTPLGEVKAFPLVCVCLPEHWKKTVNGDAAMEGPPPGGLSQHFPNF